MTSDTLIIAGVAISNQLRQLQDNQARSKKIQADDLVIFWEEEIKKCEKAIAEIRSTRHTD
jgi:hypothetical protein